MKLIHEIKAKRCQVAHLILTKPWFNLCIPSIRSVPLVTTIHDVKLHVGDRRTSILPQAVADLPAKFSRGLIVHGEALKKQLCEEFRRDPDIVSVTPIMNFSFYRHWEKSEVEEEANNILFFGSIGE
jgi:hypothetical protein